MEQMNQIKQVTTIGTVWPAAMVPTWLAIPLIIFLLHLIFVVAGGVKVSICNHITNR